MLVVHSWLNRHSSSRLLWLLLAAALSILLAVNVLDLPFSIPRLKALSGGFGILDVEPFYTADTAYRYLEAFGAEGRRLYTWGLLTVDVLLPPVITLLFAVALTLTLRRPTARAWSPMINMVPLAILTMDYLENAALLVMLATYPLRLMPLGTLAGIFTLAKHLATVVCLILIVWGNLRQRAVVAKSRKP